MSWFSTQFQQWRQRSPRRQTYQHKATVVQIRRHPPLQHSPGRQNRRWEFLKAPQNRSDRRSIQSQPIPSAQQSSPTSWATRQSGPAWILEPLSRFVTPRQAALASVLPPAASADLSSQLKLSPKPQSSANSRSPRARVSATCPSPSTAPPGRLTARNLRFLPGVRSASSTDSLS